MSVPADTRVEIQQSDYSWLDCTADVQSIANAAKMGLYSDPQTLPTKPDVGKLTIALNNVSGNYTPAANGIGTGRIDNGRGIRVKYSGKDNGKAMQATLSAMSTATTQTDVTPHNSNSTFPTVNPAVIDQPIAPTASGIVKSVIVNTANTGGVTASAVVSIYNDNAGARGALIVSATFTVGFGNDGLKTINLPYGAYFNAGDKVHVVFSSTSNSYRLWEVDPGYTYNAVGFSNPMQVSLVMYNAYAYADQTVVNSGTTGDTYVLAWQGRAQFDSQLNTDSVQLLPNAGSGATQGNTYTNKWASKSITLTTDANNTSIKLRLIPSNNIEYKNFTLKKNGGSNLLTNGDFANGTSSPWAVTNSGVTLTLTVGNDYNIVFNGKIGDIHPAAQLSNVTPITTIDVVDGVEQLKAQLATLPLQKSFTSDSLAKLALAQLPSGTLNRTVPGTIIDAGRSTFVEGGDTWVNNRTSILQIINQGVLSELTRFWVDRDGTVVVHNRDWIALRSSVTPKLTLADGESGYKLALLRSREKIRNDVVVTYHQRVTNPSIGVVGTMDQQNVYIPPLGSVSVTLTFKDSAGNIIGADNLQSLTPTTDYLINRVPTTDAAYPGQDLTNSPYFVITTEVTASQMVVTFTSITYASAYGYITFLQVRGQNVTQYNPATTEVTDATSIATYDTRPFTVDLPFQTDASLITNYANYILSNFKYPFIEAIWFECMNTSVINNVDVMSLEIGDTVSVSDSRNGLSSVIHMITNFEYEWLSGGNSEPTRIRVYLERMDQVTYWQLGVAGYGELGQKTVLYI